MRNFTIAFMILILFLSITFAIFKPMPAQNNAQNNEYKEKTYVEKLVTEPNATHDNREYSQTNFDSSLATHENTPQKINTEYNQNENILPQNEVEKPKNIIKEDIKLPRPNRNYENISKELSEKYNNNPNAEVSDEDFKYFLQKTIEQSQKDNY